MNPLPIPIDDREWRAVWEELDHEQRRRVTRSVRAAEPMRESGYAAVAAALAIRRRRQLALQIPASVVVGVFLVIMQLRTRPADPSFWYWWFWGIAALWSVVIPGVGVRRYRRLSTAERVNREVVDAASHTPGPGRKR